MKPGDVGICYFPFHDLTTAKQRRVLVIATPPADPGMKQVVVLAPITSSAARYANPGAFDCVVDDPYANAMTKPGVIRCHQLWSTETEMIASIIGSVHPDTWAKVTANVTTLFGHLLPPT